MKELKFLSNLPDEDRAELAQELKSLTDGQTTKITLTTNIAVKTAYKLSWEEDDGAYMQFEDKLLSDQKIQEIEDDLHAQLHKTSKQSFSMFNKRIKAFNTKLGALCEKYDADPVHEFNLFFSMDNK